MSCISLQNFAKDINAPIYHVIEQMNNAGITNKYLDSYISDEEKEKLYNYLQAEHGKAKVVNDEIVLPQAKRGQKVKKKKAKNRESIDTVVIDGTNLLFDHNCCHLNKVLILAEHLKKSKMDFTFYFDASTSRHLKKTSEESSQIYSLLLRRMEQAFQEVPSGIEADKIILQIATTDKAHVLSNDRYQDFTKIYEWVSDSKRLIKHHSNKSRVTIPDMNIDLKINKNNWELYKNLLTTFGLGKGKGVNYGIV